MSAVAEEDKLADALIASRWWPPDEPFPERSRTSNAINDLLPMLRETAERWTTRASKAAGQRTANQLRTLSEWLAATGARLTLSWPDLDGRPQQSWIGSRLMWWPSGIPSGRKVAWVSSRLGQAIDERSDW